MRADGKRVKNAEPMYKLIPYIMKKRYDAMNMVTVDIPLEPMKAYLNKVRNEGRPVSHMALFVAAYLRTLREFPMLNRFIVNRRIYERNEVCIAMIVLRPGDDDGTMGKLYFDMNEDVFAVQQKVEDYINQNRSPEQSNGMDDLLDTLLKLPHPILSFAVNTLMWLDRRGWLPKSIIDASPFHTSLSISNLASIRTNHVYHHTYEFGTTSLFVTMGNTRIVPMKKKGQIVDTPCLPLGIVMDERICPGSYFGQAFRRLNSLLATPELLETWPTNPPAIETNTVVFEDLLSQGAANLDA